MIALLIACTIVLVDIPCDDTALPGEWIAVSAGGLHTCGIDADGAIACFGRDQEGQSSPPDGAYAAIASGYRQSCATTSAGTVDCWGAAALDPPSGALTSLAVGGEHACGIDADGILRCWGDDRFGQLALAGAAADAVATGSIDTCIPGPRCAIGTPALAEVPTTPLSALAVGLEAACGIDGDGAVACWGAGEAAVPPSFEDPPVHLALGADFGCALTAGGSIRCWGNDEVGQATAPEGTFAALDADANGHHACALGDDRSLTCWGLDSEGQADVP